MTHDQHIASDPGRSVWVSASAGTGKTKVLTDRVLRLLLSGADPVKILCITYTRAAAAEMDSRVSARLAGWAVAEEEDLSQDVLALTGEQPSGKTLASARKLFAQVLDTPERIRIQTIHGLCQSILARFPLEAGVPPHFTLIDETTARELLAEARTQLFANAGHPENTRVAEAITQLAGHMSEGTLDKLIGTIVQERTKFQEWLAGDFLPEQIYAAVGLDTDTTEALLLGKHFSYLAEEEHALKEACAALGRCSGKTDTDLFGCLGQWLEKREQPRKYAGAFLTQDFTPRSRLCTKEAEKTLVNLKEILLAEQRRVMRWHEERRSLFVAEMSVHVTVLAGMLLELYQRFKQRRGYLDYDDLILNTSRLLSRPGVAPWVLYKLDGGIDHLLIDEAQDTSPQQWHIVEMLAAEFFAGESARSLTRTLFVVGDEKQSIFSFQGAEPQAFDAMQRKLSKLITNSGAEFSRVFLARSFRSAAPVLQAVDSVFALPEARSGLIFTESDIRHDVHRTGAAGRAELWPLTEIAQEEELPSWHVPDAATYTQRPDHLCAEQLAEKIAAWLGQQRLLASQGRPVRPGDIMILVQRRNAFAGYMLRALKRRGVPVAGADRLMLAEHIAVEDCVALANFLLLPKDDLTLAEVLRSPFIGLSEEALFDLAYSRDGHSLWERLRANDRYAKAAVYLSDILAVTDYLAPYELFTYILEKKDGRKKLAQRLGGEIDDPLNEFLTLAMEYGSTHPPSLQGFLHWLAGGDIQIKRDMEKGRDEVRIMTVHGAKGLQAPIVFLPDTARIPPHEGGIFWTREDDSVPLFSPGADAGDRHYRALRQSYREETEREYRRLLYVAMTRAEDELYICGWKGERAVSGISWYELIRKAAQDWEMQGEAFVLSSDQQDAVCMMAETQSPAQTRAVPSWALTPAADEPISARPLSPSQLAPFSDALPPYAAQARLRGILVHRLLQYLPEVAASERRQAAERIMKRYGDELPCTDREATINEVMAILSHRDFAPVFGPDSVAEASIAGVTHDASPLTLAGRIDRMAVLPDAVYIIDYKTGRAIPESEAQIPEGYLRQIDAYRQLVARIYPDKTVYCGLLWTAGPKLIILSDALLESLAA